MQGTIACASEEDRVTHDRHPLIFGKALTNVNPVPNHQVRTERFSE